MNTGMTLPWALREVGSSGGPVSQPGGAVLCKRHQGHVKIGQQGVQIIRILRVMAWLLPQKRLPGPAKRRAWGRQQDEDAAETFVVVYSQMFAADVLVTDSTTRLDRLAAFLCSSCFGVLINRHAGMMFGAVQGIYVWFCFCKMFPG